MRTLFLFFVVIFLVLPTPTVAQSKQDSLLRVWKDKSTPDSIRVAAYYSYVWDGFSEKQPDEAIRLAKVLSSFATEKKYPAAAAFAYKIVGVSYMYNKKLVKCIENLKLSLSIFRELNRKREMAQVYQNLSVAYTSAEEFKDAQGYMETSLAISEELKDEKLIVSKLLSLGSLSFSRNQPDTAKVYFERSLKILEEKANLLALGEGLMNVGKQYEQNNYYDTAIEHYERSYNVFRKLEHAEKAKQAKFQIILLFQRQDKMEEALLYFTTGLEKAKTTEDFESIAIHKESIGTINQRYGAQFSRRGDFLTGNKYQKKALEIFKELNLKARMSDCYNNIASNYYYMGNYNAALRYSKMDLKILEALGDRSRIPYNYSGLASLYSSLGNLEKAIAYTEKAIELFKEFDNQIGVAREMSSLANALLQQDKNTEAKAIGEKALKLSMELNDEQNVKFTQSLLGNIHHNLNELDLALAYHEKTLKILQKRKDNYSIAYNFASRGAVYHDQGKYKKSIGALKKALVLGGELKLLPLQREMNQRLYYTYKKLGMGNKALAHLEDFKRLDDSIRTQNTEKKLQQMEFAKQVTKDSLATVEKERKIELAHQEEVRQKNQTRNVLYGVSVFIMVIAGGTYSRLRYVRKSKAIIEKEKDRSENLLLNILPAEIAEELKIKGKADARDFDMVSILFTDFKGFTEQSAKLSAAELVDEINTCFEAFDGIMETYGIEKIKTIGDAYMAAGGLPVPTDDSVKNTVLAAFEMQDFIMNRKAKMDALGMPSFEMRVGINTGPVVAGIVGVKKFQYDIWGDTVNTASRMESNGEIGKVNLSKATYNYIKDDPDFQFESRGKVNAKGKGEIEMYFVSKASHS